MDYRTWLNKNYGQGSASTSVRAAAWRRLHGPATDTPAVATPQPSFTPGALDEAGVMQAADLDFGYQTDSRRANQEYEDTMAQINAQRPRIDQARDEAYQGADRQTAGRGMYRSGVRQQYRTDAGADADRQHQDLTLAAQRAANVRQQNLDSATGAYRTNKTNLTIGSNDRQRAAWQEQNPVTVTSPQSTVPRPPSQTYQSFLGGKKSTKSLAAQWDKKFNYGQRGF